jgi:hypothetical protein
MGSHYLNRLTVAWQECINYSSDRPEDGRKRTETCSHRRMTPCFRVVITVVFDEKN